MAQPYKQLEQNVTSTIYEGLLKIGYNNDEHFSIYYDLDLLNHLLNTSFKNNDTCYTYLLDMQHHLTILPSITISIEKNRFKFSVSKEGVEKIYSHYKKDSYLKELIELVKVHVFTLKDVIEIFDHSGHEYIHENSTNEEFQHVFYLKDNTIDPYRYCFTFDQMGGYYHRLLEYDYSRL